MQRIVCFVTFAIVILLMAVSRPLCAEPFRDGLSAYEQKDYRTAATLFVQSINQNGPNKTLATWYLNAMAVKHELADITTEEGMAYIRTMSDYLDTSSKIYYGRVFSDYDLTLAGIPYEVFLSEALWWYRQAAEEGHPAGHYGICSILAVDSQDARSQEEGITHCKKAAALNDGSAMHVLGEMYSIGFGSLQKNRNKAEKWFRSFLMTLDDEEINSDSYPISYAKRYVAKKEWKYDSPSVGENKPRGGIRCEGINYSGRNYSGLNFENEDLSEDCFKGSILVGANFRGADLRGVNFVGANVSRADFSGADLRRSDLRSAIADKAVFSGADLSYTYYSDVRFDGANFDEARMERASFVRSSFNDASFKYANLRESNFAGCELRRTQFDGAIFWETVLLDTDRRGWRPGSANLQRALINRPTCTGEMRPCGNACYQPRGGLQRCLPGYVICGPNIRPCP